MLPELTSFVAAILFAVHPVHTEAVTGVVGRAEILSSVFFLIAFISYTRTINHSNWNFLVLSMISVAVSMLCKEQGITITGICAVYEIFVVQKIYANNLKQYWRSCVLGKTIIGWSHEASWRLMLLCFTTIGLLLFRLYIMGSQLPVFTR